jgi:hypothetical protein
LSSAPGQVAGEGDPAFRLAEAERDIDRGRLVRLELADDSVEAGRDPLIGRLAVRLERSGQRSDADLGVEGVDALLGAGRRVAVDQRALLDPDAVEAEVEATALFLRGGRRRFGLRSGRGREFPVGTAVGQLFQENVRLHQGQAAHLHLAAQERQHRHAHV